MHEFKKYSPILIPTLNRFTHFKRCVESLSRCKYADKTDLFIALDYPLKESHWEGYNKIIEYLNDINGFNTINIIKRDINFGVILNIEKARESIFEKYDRLIFSEDDNEFSDFFLEYINYNLYKWEKDENIHFICGYFYPINIKSEYDILFLKEFNAWGYACWRDKFLKNSNSSFNDTKTLRQLKKLSEVSYYIVTFDNTFKVPLGDGRKAYNIVNQNAYAVFPKKTLVVNRGQDGSGQHSGFDLKLQNQNLSNFRPEIFPDKILVDENAQIEVSKYRSYSKWKKIRILLGRLYHIIRLKILGRF